MKIFGNVVGFGSAALWRQVLASCTSSIVSMCTGLTFGITAVLLPQLKKDEDFHYDSTQDSWIASVTSLAMIVGALGVGTILDKYGRRVAHIIICIPYIIGWICIASARSSTLIIIGRLITGLFSGAHRPITLVYIGEIADPKYRTVALIFPGLMGHSGVLFSHIIGGYYYWRLACVICLVPAIISMIGFLFIKESPLWLISKGRIDEGTESFRWFRGIGQAAEDELKAVLLRQADSGKTSIKEVMNIVCSYAFFKPFSVIILIVFNIQFSGINVINFYAFEIFERTFSGQIDPFAMMMVTDCVRGLVSVIVCVLAKVIPRKTAYIISSFGIALFLYILCTYLALGVKDYMWIPVTCLVLYVGMSGAIATIGWIFVPEVMPNKVRGFGSGLTSAIAYLLLFITVKISPNIMNNFGESTMYATFATSSFICGVLLSFLLPDTSGRTLQSIEDSYNKNNIIEQTAL